MIVSMRGAMPRRLLTIIGVSALLVVGQLAAPAQPAHAALLPPCLVWHPGSDSCAGTVTFSSYYLSTPFRPFQSVAGTNVQPDLTIGFSFPVRAVRVWVNDPDNSGNQVQFHFWGGGWIPFSIPGDGVSGVFSVSGVGLGGPGSNPVLNGVLLQSAANDYVNWRVEYLVSPAGSWCKITSAVQSCQGITTTTSAFVQNTVFDAFQGTPGTGVQPPIDITFGATLGQVAVTAVDPDLAGNKMEVYAANGTLMGTIDFDGDNTPGYTTTSTKTITLSGISRIRLISAAGDYTVFQGITAWPQSAPPPLSVAIDGPGYITTKGTYTFSASYSGFNPNPTFSWTERFCSDSGCSAWIPLGVSGASFNRTLSPDCSGSGTNSYELQLVMQNSDGRSATAGHTTWLCGPA
jgi:hypothetical protein